MVWEGIERRLAAILSADEVDRSRLVRDVWQGHAMSKWRQTAQDRSGS